MTPVRLVGLFLCLLGFLSGLGLVIFPFAANLRAAPGQLAVLGVGCLVLGLPLYCSGARRVLALRIAGSALTGLGLFALLGLFVDGAGLLPALRPTSVLWLVAPPALILGLLLGQFAAGLEKLGQNPGA